MPFFPFPFWTRISTRRDTTTALRLKLIPIERFLPPQLCRDTMGPPAQRPINEHKRRPNKPGDALKPSIWEKPHQATPRHAQDRDDKADTPLRAIEANDLERGAAHEDDRDLCAYHDDV